MKVFQTSYLVALVISIFMFFGCKPKEKDTPQAQPLGTEITYVGIDRNQSFNNRVVFDSTSNTFYIIFDTTKNFFSENDKKIKLTIKTKGRLSIPEISDFNTKNITLFEVEDGLDKTTKYSVVPVITSAKSDFLYTFRTYSRDGVTLENNKEIRILGVNKIVDWNSLLFTTRFSPIFEDQYSNLKDDINLAFITNDFTPLVIDNDSINANVVNAIWAYPRIENVPRDTELRRIFFQQKNYLNISGDFSFTFLRFPNNWHDITGAYADFISYNPLLETVDLDLYFKMPFNYSTETTTGGTIDGKIELRNYSIKNTNY